MAHKAIDQVLERAERAKADSDFTYYFDLLSAAEALAKTMVAGMVATIRNGKEGNRYRLEHQLVRASGLGDWAEALEDAVAGHAAEYLILEARTEQEELTKPSKVGDWQYDAVLSIIQALDQFEIPHDPLPVKTDLRKWFRLLALLRNKTKGHGAPPAHKCGKAAVHLSQSILLIYENFSLFQRPWAFLYRHLSGKYHIAPISSDTRGFESLEATGDIRVPDGVFMYVGIPRRVNLMHSDALIANFYFANGGLTPKGYEMLSYFTDDKVIGDAAEYVKPAGTLPKSETEGHGELLPIGECFTNVPNGVRDYINRPTLEKELKGLLMDVQWPIVTLVGRGGIGKTSLALKVIHEIIQEKRYSAVVWISARDIDLQLSGPKPVKPVALTPDEMAKLYTIMVLSESKQKEKGFKPRAYFEGQLQSCELGPCLFVFDNFETTQNPIEVYKWIVSFIRLPNKVLITTRLRDFKGDYAVEVGGMTEPEAQRLVAQTSQALDVTKYLTEEYTKELIKQSEGHPYVIKVLLGEVAKRQRAAKIESIVAGSDEILIALFDRTFGSLSPCAQRAFLTLSAWNSPVPRLALEALLIHSTGQRGEVEKGIEALINYSMAEVVNAPADGQEFITLPLVASAFGKKKLQISPAQADIVADVEVLQMLGATQRGDIHLGLQGRFERFLKEATKRLARGDNYEKYAPMLEAICRAYNPGWLMLARWHMDQRTTEGYNRAKEELNRFLENAPPAADANVAWTMLAECCYLTKDPLGEVHALIRRAQLGNVPFVDVSSTANRFSQFLRDGLEMNLPQKADFATRLLSVMDARIKEATSDDLSRMAWLAIHLKDFNRAKDYIKRGLRINRHNVHLVRLAERFGIAIKADM